MAFTLWKGKQYKDGDQALLVSNFALWATGLLGVPCLGFPNMVGYLRAVIIEGPLPLPQNYLGGLFSSLGSSAVQRYV